MPQCVLCRKDTETEPTKCCAQVLCDSCNHEKYADIKCHCVENTCPACYNICRKCNKICVSKPLHKPECIMERELMITECCREIFCIGCSVLFITEHNRLMRQTKKEKTDKTVAFCMNHVYVCKYCRNLTQNLQSACDRCKYINAEVQVAMDDIITHNLDDFEKNTKDYVLGIFNDLDIDTSRLDHNFYEQILRDMRMSISREMIAYATKH